MIWSMLKVILFLGAIAGLTYGAGILLETEGGVRVAAAGYELTFGPLQSAIALCLILLALWILLKLVGLFIAVVRFLNGDETAISRYFDRNRERKGYQALSDAMVALASGEGRTALSRVAKAEKYLARPELTTLVKAQAAELAGDGKKATDAYKALLENDQTRFVGVRGLMMQKIEEGDSGTALKLAEKAFALKPKHAGMQDILLKLQAEAQDWKGARTTLGAKLKSGALPRDVYRRRDAVLALQEARTVFDDSASIEAREAAIEANRLSPDLIPAAAMAARGLVMAGKKKDATRILKKAWATRPHPDLAAAFAEIEPDETPQARIKRFQALTNTHSDDHETRMLLAELLIAAEDFPGARRALGDLATAHPTARSLAIMAAIERGEGSDDAVVRGWLARALTAPRGPQWCCDKCQAIHTTWGPICENCGGFDTLSWREPPEGAGPSPTGAELLPLIVGAAKQPSTSREDIAEIVEADPVPQSSN
jgi:HemY protein